MRHPVPKPDWPESFVLSFAYDRLEVFGDSSDTHHTIGYQNRLQRVLDMVKRHARPGAKILDLAAAQGNYTCDQSRIAPGRGAFGRILSHFRLGFGGTVFETPGWYASR